MATACAAINVSEGGSSRVRKITTVPWFVIWLVIGWSWGWSSGGSWGLRLGSSSASWRLRRGVGFCAENLAVKLLVLKDDPAPGKAFGRRARLLAHSCQLLSRQ